MVAKQKEVEALTAGIEAKMFRSGELAVETVQLKNDLTDTEESLIKDQKFLKDLEKDCKKTKKSGALLWRCARKSWSHWRAPSRS